MTSSRAVDQLVSIVIPTYNCAPYIADTLGAVLAQTHQAIDIVVVDDGSTDGTPDIVARYGDPVRLVRQKNQRVCAARNHGFELSRGRFVCFLDHDDHWFPWKLRRQLETFDDRPEAGAVFTSFQLWSAVDGQFPDAAPQDPGDPGPGRLDPAFTGWIYHQFLLDCWALTSTLMMRREAFEASTRFDTRLPYAEDWDLWLRLSREHRFVKIDEVSTLYRQHELQGSRIVRAIDYRTQLLEQARARWGLASPDGRALPAAEFDRNIARYHLQFGLEHLRHGSRSRGLRALASAWRYHPTRLRYGILLAGAALGLLPRRVRSGR